MATGTIKSDMIRESLTSNQGTGASGVYERVGNMVMVRAVITKTISSWTILNGCPIPMNDQEVVIGMITNGTTNVYPVWVNSTGQLQIKDTGTFSTTYVINGSYICK